jgi:hypothetical protein
VTAVSSSQFHALLALIIVLVVCIVVEVLLVDTVFLGPGGRITNINLSIKDFFVSDTGNLQNGAYLKGSGASRKSAEKQAAFSEDKLNAPAKMNPEDEYGEDAIIVGLDSCRHYRGNLEEGDGPQIAFLGLFQNRRLSTLIQLLRKNCGLPDESETDFVYNPDIEDHFPIRRFPATVLPVILVQDPLPWINDVCKDPPARVLGMDHATARAQCPSLNIPIRLNYLEFHNSTTHNSLAHLYNYWYSPWLIHSSPRLLIRTEDLVMHPQEVVTGVCQCLGGSMHEFFRNKAPWHLESIPDRLQGYNEDSLASARKTLDKELIKTMGYNLPNAR